MKEVARAWGVSLMVPGLDGNDAKRNRSSQFANPLDDGLDSVATGFLSFLHCIIRTTPGCQSLSGLPGSWGERLRVGGLHTS